jgi:hypothetical protein
MYGERRPLPVPELSRLAYREARSGEGSTALVEPWSLSISKGNLAPWSERAIENSSIWRYCINKDTLLPQCDRQWNDPKYMDKSRWLLAQTAAKGLVLLLALRLLLGECPRSLAQNDDAGLLNQQVLQLYQQGKYQEAVPIAE